MIQRLFKLFRVFGLLFLFLVNATVVPSTFMLHMYLLILFYDFIFEYIIHFQAALHALERPERYLRFRSIAGSPYRCRTAKRLSDTLLHKLSRCRLEFSRSFFKRGWGCRGERKQLGDTLSMNGCCRRIRRTEE